jgi:hypothetical protein
MEFNSSGEWPSTIISDIYRYVLHIFVADMNLLKYKNQEEEGSNNASTLVGIKLPVIRNLSYPYYPLSDKWVPFDFICSGSILRENNSDNRDFGYQWIRTAFDIFIISSLFYFLKTKKIK